MEILERSYSRSELTECGNRGRMVLELIDQAAEVVRITRENANEIENRAKALAEGAIEELRLAQEKNQQLEEKQVAAEAVMSEAALKMQSLSEDLNQERARAQAAENRIPELEMRSRMAEARAEECEDALSRIEDAIRSKLLTNSSPFDVGSIAA
jgi:chromosome segregation ATPase